MSSSFHPRLVNGPFQDPGLFIPFAHQKRALLFDMGNLDALSARDIIKITHAFITHTHMDHFFGFDHLVRLLLGRPKTLRLYGPEGFCSQVEGKLSGYVWNLVENYQDSLVVEATEILPDRIRTKVYRCEDRFRSAFPAIEKSFDGILLQETSLTVSAEILDHQIPCLGLALCERFHVNIVKEGLDSLGLTIGPWLKDFKEALYERRSPDATIVALQDGEKECRLLLGDIAERIARITPGQKIAYISDVIDTAPNRDKMVALASQADHLFIEAAFLDRDKEQAARKYHLTAKQAGEIAGLAKVKNFSLFHFSPRYEHESSLLEGEARQAYEEVMGLSH